jgi:RNA polymerase sigma-54 factor
MSLSQGLYQKQLQKLSPQQIQLMKLLQIPTANLEERIKEEIEENPALELTDEDKIDDEFELDNVKYKLVKRNKASAIGENDGEFYTFRKKHYPQFFEKRILEL